MYSKWRLALKYLRYHFTSSNGKGHGTHSPFIFQFITNVLNDRKQQPEFLKIEKLRSRMLEDSTELVMDDLGAGSSINRSSTRTVSSIARNMAKPRKFAQLLFRVAREYQPATIVDLGTSLGITTICLALARPAARVITIEGDGHVAAIAERNFAELGIDNIRLIKGNFDLVLAGTLNELPTVDLCFVDGNHRREPTLRYFEQLLPKLNNGSILIFDDIHWSREMEEAWAMIKSHSSVRCTIDLFFIGVVFFRKEFHEKQHFTIRF